ncbi:YbjC family protein [Erwinia sp. V71]|uniref:YbjC family protein n=1 Tax=Erwinia sp. V71 TaxID=3369424 RepID=UPI003F602BB7
MRKFGELPKWVLLLEVLGIVLLILAMLSVNQWLTLPASLQGKGAATLMIFAGIALMLPAAITLMWRTAQALAPELFGRPRAKKSPNHSGDSHDADH